MHSGIARTSLPKYLSRLITLGYISRRLPATVPLNQRGRSRHCLRPAPLESRYALADQFLRFFYRFISPNLVSIEQGLFHDLWDQINSQACADVGSMRAFIGSTVFEELSQEWLRQQARLLTLLPPTSHRLPLIQKGTNRRGSHQLAL